MIVQSVAARMMARRSARRPSGRKTSSRHDSSAIARERSHRPLPSRVGSRHGIDAPALGQTRLTARQVLRTGEDVVEHRGVSLPVNVFCWLGWKQPSSVNRPTATSTPWPKRGFGRAVSTPSAASARSAPSHANAPSATITRTRSSSRELAHEVRQAGVALLRRRLVRRRRAPAPRRRTRSRAASRRRGRPMSAGSRSPPRCSDANRKSPERSPVKIAAGAIAAVRRRREPDDQHPRRRIAEARHRPAPVRPVGEARDLLSRDLLAPRDQPRARAARDDLGLDPAERAGSSEERERAGPIPRTARSASVSGRRPVAVSMNVRSDHPRSAVGSPPKSATQDRLHDGCRGRRQPRVTSQRGGQIQPVHTDLEYPRLHELVQSDRGQPRAEHPAGSSGHAPRRDSDRASSSKRAASSAGVS